MYTCTTCAYASSTKLGKCPSCGEFATFEWDEKWTYAKKSKDSGQVLTTTTHDIQSTVYPLSSTELRRVFGEWIQSGGVYLLGGEPGIGKSTLVLQIIADLQENSSDIITGYCSAEEHPQHVADRRARIVPDSELRTNIYRATDVADIVATMQENDHQLMIIDSIQTIHSSQSDAPAGSPNQVRIVSEQLVAAAKQTNTALIIVGHVTKGGEIAGPKYLEHIVDVVLYLEGDSDGQLRFLRVKKNRFGPTHDTGIFDMTLFGLQPVYDMQTRMLERFHSGVPWSALTIGLDNGRPVLVSIEVLLNKTSGKYPLRRCIGVDKGRVDMIIAVLEKYCQCKLGFIDIYINVPGDMEFHDSGIDIAIAVAILSQYHSRPLDTSTVFVWELGLTGHISKARAYDKRISTLQDDTLTVIDHTTKHILALSKEI